MPEPEVQFESIDPDGSIEVLMEGIDEIPATDAAEEPEFRDISKADIIAKVKLERAELAKAKEQATNQAAITQTLKELKDRPPLPAGLQVPSGPPETEEQFKAKFNEQFYNDPYNTMMEFQRKKLGPEVQRIMMSNMQLSRKLAALDPDRKETFATYSAEIDDFVARLRPEEKLYDADVYVKAHDAIIARHVNEIVDRKVREAMGTGKTASPTKPAFTEAGGTAPPPRMAGKQTIVLTRAEQQYAAAKGISKERMGEWLLRNPEKRMK